MLLLTPIMNFYNVSCTIQSKKHNYIIHHVLNALLLKHNSGSLQPIQESKSLEDTILEAEKLKEFFHALVDHVMMATKSVRIDMDQLKLHIIMHLQFAHQTTLEVQSIIFELEKQATSPDAAVRFLVAKNLLGYLNFTLLKVFKNFLSEKVEVVKKINDYEQQHDQFIQHNLKTIIDVFKRCPHLAPVSQVGLPIMTVELEQPWENRSLYQWKEVMKDVGLLPEHFLIKSIEKKCIIIAYSIWPFFLSTVTKQLHNPNVTKALVNVGASFTIEPEVEMLGLSESKFIKKIIEHANSMLKHQGNGSSASMKISKTTRNDSLLKVEKVFFYSFTFSFSIIIIKLIKFIRAAFICIYIRD